MRLIANKPCSFGGRQFYIGDEIPANLVADARVQEKMGVITVANDTERVPAEESGTLFTQEQVEKMVAEAVNNSVLEMEQKQKELQEAAGILQEDGFWFEGTVIISVKGGSDGDNEQQMAVQVTPEEIQQVFSIMQMNAEEGAKAISDVTSENVLILLHAVDSRTTIKNAAKKQADKLFTAGESTNESGKSNETKGVNTEGADA